MPTYLVDVIFCDNLLH